MVNIPLFIGFYTSQVPGGAGFLPSTVRNRPGDVLDYSLNLGSAARFTKFIKQSSGGLEVKSVVILNGILSQMVHVWFIYLYISPIFMVNVGKSSIHGACGYHC